LLSMPPFPHPQKEPCRETHNLRHIAYDWHGKKTRGEPQWGLDIKGGFLSLRGVVYAPPMRLSEGRGGSFVEGVWEKDLIELFLLNPDSGYYVEFNLGPQGEWWWCTFIAPRVRAVATPRPLLGVITNACISEESWDSTLYVPLSSLPRRLAFCPDTTKGNIAFCLGDPQQYITLADLGDGPPDFHRPDKWIPLAKLLGANTQI